MIIVPTRVCNTDKCSYCGVLKKDFDKKFFDKNLDLNSFIKKIKLLSEKSGDYNLRFFGGEPFLKFEIIKKIIISLSALQASYPLVKGQELMYNFIINTNLSLIKKDYLNFLKKYNIKLIISCNGDLYSHTRTRNLEAEKTLILYENIKKIVEHGIDYQINIVTTPKIVDRLYKNFKFIRYNLGAKVFNLLPVNYNGWTDKGLEILREELNIISEEINNKKLDIEFINKTVNNDVSLFNSEITVDSDGKVYPSMVILEKFFKEEKSKIQITDLNKNFEEIKIDLENYEIDNHKIYDKYINKILNKKFENIIENDNESSKIFSDFLKNI